MHRDNPYLTKKPDFARLASRFPDFAQYVTISEEGYASIDFQNPAALRSLTRCLLKEDWDLDVGLREDRLCPTLTNRLDYLLHVLDLEPYLAASPSSRPLRVLDIGTGATAIYPILLHRLRPDAQITATELDELSYNHSLSVLSQNSIPSSSINAVHAPSAEPILFPILDNEREEWDLTICNPPFFGSEEEMKEGQEGKELGAHAAPTAANNELITPGGEIAFVGKMIKESLKIGERCRWYTSLIGKYSSLTPLIELLREHKIDNYLLKSIKQSKTTRWILGWSYSSIRISDNIARPEEIIPNTSFSRLIPLPNSFTHKPQPAIPNEELKQKIQDVLKSANLVPLSLSTSQGEGQDENTVMIEPKINTWSRAARRALARKTERPPDTTADTHPVQEEEGFSKPLFKARIQFIPPITLKDFSSISLDWLEGRDRSLVERLWKFLLNKAELVGKKEHVDAGYGGRLGDGAGAEVWRRGRGRGRGRGSGGGRSRGREREGNEEDSMNEGRRYGQRRRLA
ncbi:hypothetical protein I302_104087 [Kwoniella bestiolae CBS 10118]|uniref:U6 small nuclear RNA (adenine-(43)-N(6))-methyltransferase n=1 Tax=Kwoniella bestiolae CBS 10118 TaxID=1296100 RepID=A0AAJ8K7E4_9TREE